MCILGKMKDPNMIKKNSGKTCLNYLIHENLHDLIHENHLILFATFLTLYQKKALDMAIKEHAG